MILTFNVLEPNVPAPALKLTTLSSAAFPVSVTTPAAVTLVNPVPFPVFVNPDKAEPFSVKTGFA